MLLAGWWNACREVDRCSQSCFRARGPTCTSSSDKRLYFYAGQHGYLVRPGPHLRRVLSVLEGQPVKHVDEMRCWGQGDCHLRTYALSSRFVLEDPVTSQCSTRAYDEPTLSFYVGYVPLGWSDTQLLAFARRFGAVEDASVCKPREPRYDATYGFLTVRQSSADAVLSGLRNAEAAGRRRFTCRLAERRASQTPKPPLVVPAPARRPGSRGPLPGSMLHVGRAGRGRPRGSKNRKLKAPMRKVGSRGSLPATTIGNSPCSISELVAAHGARVTSLTKTKLQKKKNPKP